MSTGIETSLSDEVAFTRNGHAMQQGDVFTYALYLHREELRKRFSSPMGISRTKLLLTQELITRTVKNINKCSAADLQILSRETIFKKNLRREIARQRHRQYLQMMRLKHQQNESKTETKNSTPQQQGNNDGLQHQSHIMHQQFRNASDDTKFIDLHRNVIGMA